MIKFFSKKNYKFSNFDTATISEYNKGRNRVAKKNICNAPQTSLYFGLGGKVNTCCYTKYFAIDNIKNKTINEIWFGEKFETFRAEVSEYYLNTQCLECKKQIRAENYKTVYSKKYDEYANKKNKYPSVIEFELDNTCNLECEMCNGTFSSAIRKNREKLPPLVSPYGNDFLKQLEEYLPHVKQANFLGGEPFLIKTYIDIWEKIIEINPKIQIYVQTNATILNSRIKKILEKTNFSFGISMDSFQKNTYEFIRKNAKFETVLQNFDWFHHYCKEKGTFFGVSICAMPQNWKEIPSIIKECNKKSIAIYFNTVIKPDYMSFYHLQHQEIENILNLYQSTILPSKSIIEKKNKIAFQSLIRMILEYEKSIIENSSTKIKYKEFKEMLINEIKDSKYPSEIKKKNKILNLQSKFKSFEKYFNIDELNYFSEKITNYDKENRLNEIIYNIEKTNIKDLILDMKQKIKNGQ